MLHEDRKQTLKKSYHLILLTFFKVYNFLVRTKKNIFFSKSKNNKNTFKAGSEQNETELLKQIILLNHRIVTLSLKPQ